MENVITLGKLIGLLFCSVPPLYFVFETPRNELARPVMGTIILVTYVLAGTRERILNGGCS